MENLENIRKELKKAIDKHLNYSLLEGEKIFKEIDNKEDVLYYIFCKIINCTNCTYRYLIYNTFNFDQSSYMILQLAGMLEINNLEKKDIKCNKKDIRYKKGREIFKSIEHDNRLNMLTFIIYNFIKNRLNYYNIDFIKKLYVLYKKEYL